MVFAGDDPVISTNADIALNGSWGGRNHEDGGAPFSDLPFLFVLA